MRFGLRRVFPPLNSLESSRPHQRRWTDKPGFGWSPWVEDCSGAQQQARWKVPGSPQASTHEVAMLPGSVALRLKVGVRSNAVDIRQNTVVINAGNRTLPPEQCDNALPLILLARRESLFCPIQLLGGFQRTLCHGQCTVASGGGNFHQERPPQLPESQNCQLLGILEKVSERWTASILKVPVSLLPSVDNSQESLECPQQQSDRSDPIRLHGFPHQPQKSFSQPTERSSPLPTIHHTGAVRHTSRPSHKPSITQAVHHREAFPGSVFARRQVFAALCVRR